MEGDEVLALVETKLDQVQAATDDLRRVLERAEGMELSEDQQDRLILLLLKFGRHVSKPLTQ